MSTQAIHAPSYCRELGNGLRLRWSAAADVGAGRPEIVASDPDIASAGWCARYSS